MPEESKYQFDSSQIALVADLMEIDEFALFEEAFEAWFGKDSVQEVIEPYFEQYRNEEIVPFWVRSHIKTLLRDHDRSARRQPGQYAYFVRLACLLPPFMAIIYLIYVLAEKN